MPSFILKQKGKNYYGYDNNKTGSMQFIKISKEEFEVYQRDPE